MRQVPVKGFAVDCAAHGEPFCIIFWPDAQFPADFATCLVLAPCRACRAEITPPSEYESIGLEVKVSGLTGQACRCVQAFRVCSVPLKMWVRLT